MTSLRSEKRGAFVGKRGTLEERFWRYVTKRGDDECWLWTGNKNNDGYGMIGRGGVSPSGSPRMALAHRVSWELHRGPIPDGAIMCHRCDVPACVNPAHLFPGSHSDNTRDAIEKGRRPPQPGRSGRSDDVTFKVGDRVEWTSQAAGVKRTKIGAVVEVVPRGRHPVQRVDGGFPRDHESYVVRAVALGRKSGERPAYYWPRVVALRTTAPPTPSGAASSEPVSVSAPSSREGGDEG